MWGALPPHGGADLPPRTEAGHGLCGSDGRDIELSCEAVYYRGMKLKGFGIVSILCLAATLLWLGLLVHAIASRGSLDTAEKAAAALSGAGAAFYLTYINAALITILATVLFAGLYLACRERGPALALVGIVFVPVYCVLNLVVYLSQVSAVPAVVGAWQSMGNKGWALLLLGLLVQELPYSLAALLNTLAYAVLAVPSILFGRILLCGGKWAWISGITLILSGACSIAGLVGLVARVTLLAAGTVLGGVLFIVALGFVTAMFLGENQLPSPRQP
jgi:hypothetical protein